MALHGISEAMYGSAKANSLDQNRTSANMFKVYQKE